MWRKSSSAFLPAILIGAFALSGCSTIVRKRTQSIPVTASPRGAIVFVNGTRQGEAPLEVKLARSKKNQIIRIEAAGYRPVEIRLKRRLSNASILGNILLAVPCAFAVPLITKPGFDTGEMGAFYRGIGLRTVGFAALFLALDLASKRDGEFLPKDLYVTLEKPGDPSRVETVLLDAGDWTGVRSIRIRSDRAERRESARLARSERAACGFEGPRSGSITSFK